EDCSRFSQRNRASPCMDGNEWRRRSVHPSRSENSDAARCLELCSSKVPHRENAAKQRRRFHMHSIAKSRFLLTTAVLLAGVSLGSAQGMHGGGGGGMGAGGGAGAGASGGGGAGAGGSAGGGASTHEKSSGGMSAGGGAGGGAAAHERAGGGMRAGGQA